MKKKCLFITKLIDVMVMIDICEYNKYNSEQVYNLRNIHILYHKYHVLSNYLNLL